MFSVHRIAAVMENSTIPVFVTGNATHYKINGNSQKHLLSFRFSITPMTLQSTETCFSISLICDPILSITPTKFFPNYSEN
jgi:hypothetical protein